MSEDGVVVYGTAWCGDCRRVKKLLERRGIDYAWVDVEGRKGARDEMLRLNGGDRRVPTLLFPDGSVLVEPSSAELIAKLEGRDRGADRRPRVRGSRTNGSSPYDVRIIDAERR